MLGEFPEEYNNLNLEVNIKNVIEGSVASKLTGFFFINEKKFVFSAVAFGRIGGQNVNVKISKSASKEIKKMGYDPETIVLLVQSKIIEGDINIFDRKKTSANK
ncbi:MAG: hypothetical protein AB7V56_05500 [Candidatus Nitrosocosmicus sp.]